MSQLIEIVRELVDPVQVASLLVQKDFAKLVRAVRELDKHRVDIYTNKLNAAGYEDKIIIAALEKVS